MPLPLDTNVRVFTTMAVHCTVQEVKGLSPQVGPWSAACCDFKLNQNNIRLMALFFLFPSISSSYKHFLDQCCQPASIFKNFSQKGNTVSRCIFSIFAHYIAFFSSAKLRYLREYCNFCGEKCVHLSRRRCGFFLVFFLIMSLECKKCWSRS